MKDKLYSEYFSHELNLFIRSKDPLYFTRTVRPFLVNKLEKTFVDYWLLGMAESMTQFIEPQSKHLYKLSLTTI